MREWNDWTMEELTPSTSTEVARFADESMFIAQPTTSMEPSVKLLDAPNDPLGKLAYLAKAYQGKFPASYEAISDADRMYYVQDMEKNILGMPSEAVMFHFVIENVSRSFTHQLVRTRHASYAQESMRFAVKEDFPVRLPASLQGVKSLEERARDFADLMGWPAGLTPEQYAQAHDTVLKTASEKERQRDLWERTVGSTRSAYLELVNSGMPAEEARDIAPHGILTRINMAIDLRSLMQMAGQRLCTQAQWEHKMVWDGIINSVREFGRTVHYRSHELPRAGVAYSEAGDHEGNLAYEVSSQWQYEFLAARFKPICYQTGRCQFRSDFDRYCNIRDRVEANAAIGRPSKEWHEPHVVSLGSPGIGQPEEYEVAIPSISPFEWLRPDAAIRKTGDWRSEEAQRNIAGRR